MTYHSLLSEFVEALSPLYGEIEARAIFYYYMEQQFQLSKLDLALCRNKKLFDDDRLLIMNHLHKLKSAIPVQYLLGRVNFMDTDFEVNSEVLIPRQETEELIDFILKENENPNLRVLDIGTGSGIIAISLEKKGKFMMFATDVSTKALTTAMLNAQNNHLQIRFILHDILRDEINQLPDNLDIIVSNPPYIPLTEREKLHPNVKNFEPELALFVPDDDPLIFYKKIADIGNRLLKPGGKLYFETYHLFHKDLVKILAEKHYTQIVSIQDISGKDRFIKCIKS